MVKVNWGDIEDEVAQMDEQEELEDMGFVTGTMLDEGITCIFLQEEPYEIEGKFGRQLAFPVKIGDGKYTLATSSKRLMKQLLYHHKETGLTEVEFEIQRQGNGFETSYEMIRVSK